MCEFWRNHFCIDNSPGEAKVRSWAAVRYEEDVIRKHVFGKFKNMLFASATHPAMLEYLDNGISQANNWNENYAREVMELHTLGADRGYNNYDVQELSKVLTGWTWDTALQLHLQGRLSTSPATRTVLGMQIPQGYDGGEQALYILATHPNTAEFISRKLCQYLVNDTPPPALVAKVASVFTPDRGRSAQGVLGDHLQPRVRLPRELPGQVQDAVRLHRQRAARHRCEDRRRRAPPARSWPRWASRSTTARTRPATTSRPSRGWTPAC